MWGRSLYQNIQRFLLFQLTVNVAACFIVLVGAGSFLTLDLIWILADIVNGLMAFPNLVALIGLRKEIISETKDYFERLKATQHDQDELA